MDYGHLLGGLWETMIIIIQLSLIIMKDFLLGGREIYVCVFYMGIVHGTSSHFRNQCFFFKLTNPVVVLCLIQCSFSFPGNSSH